MTDVISYPNTDAEFAQQTSGAKPAIVYFWAPWCVPCKSLAPVVEKFAADTAGTLTVVKVNADDHTDWAQRYGVSGLPTLLFMKDGEPVKRLSGTQNLAKIQETARELLAS